MLRDILAASIAMQNDMVIVDGDDNPPSIESGSDLVIIPDDGSMCSAVLAANARHGVIAVCRDGRAAVLCRLVPGRSVVREISAETLVESIRELASN
jgi:hypothetical protein